MTETKAVSEVFIAHKGEIVKHNVLIRDSERLYIDRLDESQTVVFLDENMLGVHFFDNFEDTKKSRIKRCEQLVKDFEKEIEDLKTQEKAVVGIIKPEKLDEQ